MVDSNTRKQLSQDVRRLIIGRMTNDQFDDAYYERYRESEDSAVREISGMCYSLYSSDLPIPYRLTGRHAVDSETRAAAARAILFLRTGRDYEWPTFPHDPVYGLVAGIALFLGIPTGTVLSLVCIPLSFSDPVEGVSGPLAVLGVFLLVGSSCLAFCTSPWLRSAVKAFKESGDYEAWPFLRNADLEIANHSCHLLKA